jgi:hypothetical protein
MEPERQREIVLALLRAAKAAVEGTKTKLESDLAAIKSRLVAQGLVLSTFDDGTPVWVEPGLGEKK